ncbi:hypothetical protein P3T33_004923 [Rhizobium sp. AN67]|nr:hypothetical protein [Rhizobium sp. AN67]SOD56453.1 hypothetical protein SAMN05216595_3092 [Rhizobium sp. AN6A]
MKPPARCAWWMRKARVRRQCADHELSSAFGRGFFVCKGRAMGNGLPLRPAIVLEESGRENIRASEYAAYPPLPCRASPPQGGREIGKRRPRCAISTVKKGETLPRVDLPTCGGDARQGRGGVSRTHQHPQNPSPDKAKTPPQPFHKQVAGCLTKGRAEPPPHQLLTGRGLCSRPFA